MWQSGQPYCGYNKSNAKVAQLLTRRDRRCVNERYVYATRTKIGKPMMFNTFFCTIRGTGVKSLEVNISGYFSS